MRILLRRDTFFDLLKVEFVIGVRFQIPRAIGTVSCFHARTTERRSVEHVIDLLCYVKRQKKRTVKQQKKRG